MDGGSIKGQRLASTTVPTKERVAALSRVLLIVAGLLGVTACATLPDVEQELAVLQPDPVDFQGTQGTVSEASSEAILERMELDADEPDSLAKHLAYEQEINADSPLVLGNKLTLLQNGPATYQAMFAAIRAARDHINMETYIFEDDETGNEFADLLLERQAAGVQVNLIFDSFGSMFTPDTFFDRLQDGGVRVLEFNPLNPLSGQQEGWLLNNRDHRKQLIIDGRIVFTGGINISDTYSSTPLGIRAGKNSDQAPEQGAGWRDTHIQIEGPVVAEFQKLFMETWVRKNAEPLTWKNYYPELKPQGNEIVRAIGSKPGDPHSLIYMTLISAISHAESKVHITIAYFAPDPQLLKALTDAARRGVEVILVLPSYSDSWPVFHLGRSHYTELLREGVRIFERHGALMHAKTVCIDDVWSTIGSTNLDWRSFLHNDEINAVILGRDFAAQMETILLADIKESEEILLEKWRRRSWLLRLKEHLAMIGAYWL